MKKNLILTIGICILIMFGAIYVLYRDEISHNGRLYPSKTALCMEFAKSYLRTIQKTESNFNDEKWAMAVDLETELYNMCLLELNEDALASFRAHALEKYKK